MREKDVNYFENTFVNKVICQENSCIKRTFHFKVNFEHQSTTFQRKTRKIRNKNGTCSFMWPLSKMLPYQIDKLPFLQFAKKPLDAILAKNSHKKGMVKNHIAYIRLMTSNYKNNLKLAINFPVYSSSSMQTCIKC